MSYSFMGEFMFISHHSCLLQSHTSGEMHAERGIDEVGREERWHVYRWADGAISLRNFRISRWLCAEPSGRVVCDRERVGPWEKWSLQNLDGNRVALLSYHGRWLCGEPPTHRRQVVADREECREWEQWSMQPSEGLPIWRDFGEQVLDLAERAALIALPILLA